MIATPAWCSTRSPTWPIRGSSSSAPGTARCPAGCSPSTLGADHGVRHQPRVGRGTGGVGPRPQSACRGADRRRHRHRRARWIVRPGGVRAVVPSPAAPAGGPGAHRGDAGGGPFRHRRSGPATRAAAPHQAGHHGAAGAAVALRPRRADQFASHLQSLGVPGTRPARRSTSTCGAPGSARRW